MPAAYTHFSIAKNVLERLSPPLKAAVASLKLYFFGAQGADFCFFYRALHPSEINFGRFLHNRGSYEFFLTLEPCARRNSDLLSYAFGYITHYAADCIFHPYVYHVSGKSPVKHTLSEGALDFYFSRKLAKDNPSPNALHKYFNCALDEADVSTLYALYALAAARADRNPLLKTAFAKSIKSYRTYTKFSMCMFAKENSELLNADHREWSYPDDETKILTDGADELFTRTVEKSLELISEFSECIEQKRIPSKESFGKNFLSGL